MFVFKEAEDKEWLRGILRSLDKVQVTFTKTDGTERVMNCTLKEDVIMPYVKKTDTVKEVNEDVLPVFDLDKKAWRSFRYDSITNIYFDL